MVPVARDQPQEEVGPRRLALLGPTFVRYSVQPHGGPEVARDFSPIERSEAVAAVRQVHRTVQAASVALTLSLDAPDGFPQGSPPEAVAGDE